MTQIKGCGHAGERVPAAGASELSLEEQWHLGSAEGQGEGGSQHTPPNLHWVPIV